jgi:hypothetical protein
MIFLLHRKHIRGELFILGRNFLNILFRVQLIRFISLIILQELYTIESYSCNIRPAFIDSSYSASDQQLHNLPK